MLDIAGRTAAARQRSPLRRPGRRALIRAGVIVVLFLFVLLALPQLLSLYYIDAMTQVVVYSVVTLGLGVLVGRPADRGVPQGRGYRIGRCRELMRAQATERPR